MEIVRLTSLNKIVFLLIFFWMDMQVFATPLRQKNSLEEYNLAEIYKAVKIDKTENQELLIETEIYGKPNFSRIIEISRLDGGTYYSYHFYKVNEDNICLGINASNPLQEKSVVYINTQKECGAKCKVYLSKPEERQIFYFWEPLKENIRDNEKESIIIETDQKTYSIKLKKEIKELELNIGGKTKLKSIKGLEKFSKLINLSLVGFDF